MNRYKITYITADGLTNEGRVVADTEEAARAKASEHTWSGKVHAVELACELPALPDTAEDAVTFGFGSDSYPGTIIKRTKTTITFQEDYATSVGGDGYSETQRYTYARDPEGAIHRAHLNARGRFRSKSAGPVHIGSRRMYRDPSF